MPEFHPANAGGLRLDTNSRVSLWSPKLLAPALWLDAADLTTITSSGGAVSQWNDKSGNGRHVTQATAANQPTTGTVTQNGLNAMSFDGNDLMSVAALDLSSTAAVTLCAVFTAGSGGDQIVAEHSTNYNNAKGFLLYRTSTNVVFWGASDPVGKYSAFETTATLTTTAKLLVATSDRTLTTNESTAWINDVTAGSRPFNDNLTGNYASAGLFVGARSGVVAGLNGSLCELILVPRVITASERTAIHNYAQAKWAV